MWVIGVTYKSKELDPIGLSKKSEMKDFNLNAESVSTMHVYFVNGKINKQELERACKELFSDSQTQQYVYAESKDSLSLVKGKDAWVVEVKNKPGVTDAVGESARKALRLLGAKGVESVESAFTYAIRGRINEQELKTVCEKIFANSLIQDYHYRKI